MRGVTETLADAYREQLEDIANTLVSAGVLTREQVTRQGVRFAVREAVREAVAPSPGAMTEPTRFNFAVVTGIRPAFGETIRGAWEKLPATNLKRALHLLGGWSCLGAVRAAVGEIDGNESAARSAVPVPDALDLQRAAEYELRWHTNEEGCERPPWELTPAGKAIFKNEARRRRRVLRRNPPTAAQKASATRKAKARAKAKAKR